MRINQCKIPESNKTGIEGFMKRYSLKPYYDKNSPSIFYSLWGMNSIQKHKSLAIIVWRGTDIVKNIDKLKYLRKKSNVKHVAVSSFIAEDCKKAKLKYKYIPIVSTRVEDFETCPLGEEIYTYIPNRNIKYFKRYGRQYVDTIKKKCSYKINISESSTHYSRKKLIKIYERCFCGLRLTAHDGLPNQVIEMGLMGRKNVYNGDIPGSINWDPGDIDSVVRNIDQEFSRVGKINYDLSEKIKQYIDVGDSWLNTEFWS
jgi:hypothetical protein